MVQKSALADDALSFIETKSKNGILNEEISAHQKGRCQFEGLPYKEIATEGAMSDIGFTEDEAVFWHGIYKKSDNKLNLVCENTAKVWEEKHVIIDSNQQILNCTYFVAAYKCMSVIRDSFHQIWRNLKVKIQLVYYEGE
ncbi:hypothetical protein M9Y10_025641 [Tritrichomonas musculus]|uniref:Uncharacterized protein n=1 Tax=Tritrichomonas musculus TaxID=1915356 RepID=A0ABR2GK05_9EUKA